jgi:hypothetical protein
MNANPDISSQTKAPRKMRTRKEQDAFVSELCYSCGTTIEPGEDLAAGFERAISANPVCILSKCADGPSVAAVQKVKSCNKEEAILDIYGEMRRGMKNDPVKGWDPVKGGLGCYMGRGTRIAARRIVERSSSAWGVTISLDDLPHNPEDDSYNADDAVPDLSTPAAAEVVEQMDLLEALQAGLDALGPEERKIVRMYYGLDEEEDVSIRQASLRMGIHKNSGKEVLDRALRKLRKALDA